MLTDTNTGFKARLRVFIEIIMSVEEFGGFHIFIKAISNKFSVSRPEFLKKVRREVSVLVLFFEKNKILCEDFYFLFSITVFFPC